MKIICVGRNYAEHAKELNNQVPKEPVIFLKPDSAVLPKNHPFVIPAFTDDIHYEVELLVKINRLGKHIEERFAHKYYDEVGLGIDFTARSLQSQLKEQGLPWEKAKGFDGSAVIGDRWFDKNEFKDLNNIDFKLIKNDETVQSGSTSDMIFNIDQLIAYVSKFFTLKIGDVLFTGTPKGVGKVSEGDQLSGFIGSEMCFNLKIC